MTSARVDRLWRRFRAYLEGGQLAAAQATLESLVLRKPNDPAAQLALAKLLLRRGQLQAASDHLLVAAGSLPPDDAGMACDIAQHLAMTGETVAARTCLDRAQAMGVESTSVLVSLAHLRYRLGESEAALTLIEHAMSSGADSPYDHHFHAMLLQFVGRIDEAERELHACLRRWPQFGSAALTQARLRRQTPETAHLDYLHEQLRQVSPNSLDHASFEFALFKELDDLGRFDEAWPSLQRANAIMHARNPYDLAGDQQMIAATMEACGSDFFARDTAGEPFDGPMPIFVLGMPRSGTTLLDRMLGNHSNVASAGEISDFFDQWCRVAGAGGQDPGQFLACIRRSADIDFRELGARYLKQTQWRAQGRPFFIDKMPNNFPLIGFIRRALPQARILCLKREPMAVCFSNFKAMFGDSSAHSYSQQFLGRYHQVHERLHAHWKATGPDVLMEVSYEALVQAPDKIMHQVLAFCGLDFEAACVDPTRNTGAVSTPSSAQVRGAIHGRGLDEWKHYEAQLAPLRTALWGGR